MRWKISCSERFGPLEARRVGEVALHAEHGLDVGLARRRVHRERAVHVPVVGDADRGLTVGGDGRDDLADARRTVEHRVLGVQMQMDERVALGIVETHRALRSGFKPGLNRPAPVIHRTCGQSWGKLHRCNSTNSRRPRRLRQPQETREAPMTRGSHLRACRRTALGLSGLLGFAGRRPLREPRVLRRDRPPPPPRRPRTWTYVSGAAELRARRRRRPARDPPGRAGWPRPCCSWPCSRPTSRWPSTGGHRARAEQAARLRPAPAPDPARALGPARPRGREPPAQRLRSEIR